MKKKNELEEAFQILLPQGANFLIDKAGKTVRVTKPGFKRGTTKPHMCRVGGEVYAFIKVGHKYSLVMIHDDELGKNIAAIVQSYGLPVERKEMLQMGIQL